VKDADRASLTYHSKQKITQNEAEGWSVIRESCYVRSWFRIWLDEIELNHAPPVSLRGRFRYKRSPGHRPEGGFSLENASLFIFTSIIWF
jgi:hypothetical protein